MQRTSTVIMLAILAVTLAWGHGKHENLLGTVSEVTGDTITIETTQKEKRTIAYDQQTRFEKSGVPAEAGDLKVGERVAIEVHTVKGKPHAARVRFGPPKRAAQPE